MAYEVWVEHVGNLIIARLRGMPNTAAIIEANRCIYEISKRSGIQLVLCDGLEMESPPQMDENIATVQWEINDTHAHIPLIRAIVVPNTRLAYLARLAFGDGKHRVFYNDISGAILWLNSQAA